MSIQRWLNMPNRPASTLSPGESVLESEASQAPVPLAGKRNAWPVVVLKIFFSSWSSGRRERRGSPTSGGPPWRGAWPGGSGRARWWARERRGWLRPAMRGTSVRVMSIGRERAPPPAVTSERLHWKRRVNIYAPTPSGAPSILHCTFFHKPGASCLPSEPTPSPAALLADLYASATAAVDPGPALSRRLAALPSGGAPRWIIALGKAALPMAQAAVETLAVTRCRACGRTRSCRPRRHRPPIPGSGSFPATTRSPAPAPSPRPKPSGRSLPQAARGEEVWVLLSGGATSLLGAPVEGITPAELTALYALLLGSGLDITAMNRIRKRFSRWGGGRLALALAPASGQGVRRLRRHRRRPRLDRLRALRARPLDGARGAQTSSSAPGLWERIPESARRQVREACDGDQMPKRRSRVTRRSRA